MEEMEYKLNNNDTESKTSSERVDTVQTLSAIEQKEFELFLKLHIANHRPG